MRTADGGAAVRALRCGRREARGRDKKGKWKDRPVRTFFFPRAAIQRTTFIERCVVSSAVQEGKLLQSATV